MSVKLYHLTSLQIRSNVFVLSISDKSYTIESTQVKKSNDYIKEQNQQPDVLYPHDAEQVLKELDPNIIVRTIYLTPNVRQSIGIIRRLKHDVDIFINLYSNVDETANKIIEYMQNEGIAFTGASFPFNDPTRIELKRLCRYNQLPTPKFALIIDLDKYNDDTLNQVVDKLDGFPLFVKPEHGYDSVGINEKSLVRNVTDMKQRCSPVIDEFGGALIEQYIEGREFTVLVIGTKHMYQAFNGDGYARMDIRQDQRTKQLFILDCNPNCSIFYRDSCSADFICQVNSWSKSRLMKFLLDQDSAQWQPINHSCDPNVWIDGFQYVARRPIHEGEQLTVDYSTYTVSSHDFECWCKSPLCQRRIQLNEYKEKWFQDRYGSHTTSYIQMLIEIDKMKNNKL
ncbi:unnamed protein product [Adineta steineri]|uniref:SET domain-containing protein n=1 Tax=Adineta steineri TaxID=433720 RepID=A0A814LAB9_9BILA|nr:unnamed protein product [Adineta steineri]CAF1160758.1 unnamed protein product [Adineta steineri]